MHHSYTHTHCGHKFVHPQADAYYTDAQYLKPLTAGAAYIRVFIFY